MYVWAGPHHSDNWGENPASWACRVDAVGAVVWCRDFLVESGLGWGHAVVAPSGDLVVIGYSGPTGTPYVSNGPVGGAIVVRVDRVGGGTTFTRQLSSSGNAKFLPRIIRRRQPGYFTATGAVIRSVDEWFRDSCGDSGQCARLPSSTCDDGNPCTRDECVSAPQTYKHACTQVALPDGVTCAVAVLKATGHCKNSKCVSGPK